MGAETADSNKPPRIRLGMVGGGRDAFIGGVHRMAARLDDHYELIAGAFSSTEEKSKASAAELGIDDGLVRLSVGIEDLDDLIADIDQALT